MLLLQIASLWVLDGLLFGGMTNRSRGMPESYMLSGASL